MSNYPDDFKDTNMEGRADMSAPRKLRAIDVLPILLLDYIKDYNQKNDLETDPKDMIGHLHDMVVDSYFDEKHQLMDACGFYQMKSPTDIFLESFRPRQLTNPSTFETKGDPL